MLKIKSTDPEKRHNSASVSLPSQAEIIEVLRRSGKLLPSDEQAKKELNLQKFLKGNTDLVNLAEIASGIDCKVYVFEKKNGETGIIKVYRPIIARIIEKYALLTRAALRVLPEVSQSLNDQFDIDGKIYDVEYTAVPISRIMINDGIAAVFPDWIQGDNWNTPGGQEPFTDCKQAIVLSDCSIPEDARAFLMNFNGDNRYAVDKMIRSMSAKLCEALGIDRQNINISRLNVKGSIDQTKRQIRIIITDLCTDIMQMKDVRLPKSE